MPFVLRDENTVDNPPLATVYGKQITAGKMVYYIKEAGRTKCIIILGQGEMDSIERLYYNGEIIPEFADAGNAIRNWKFHPGTKTKNPVFKDVTALTTDTLTLEAGHGFIVGSEVALVAGVDLATNIYPSGVTQHKKLYVVHQSGNNIKLSLTSGGTALSGWPTSGENNTYLLSNLKVYKADAGYFDPVQGRPDFFPSLDFTFSEICYVEVWLDAVQSQVEDEAPSRFKIFVNGRKLQNYDSNGLLADAAGAAYPDQNNLPAQTKFFTANNALVAVDIMLNYMKLSPSRIDWATFVKFRNHCYEATQWDSGETPSQAYATWKGLYIATLSSLVNATLTVRTFSKTVGANAWDSGGLSSENFPDTEQISVSGTVVEEDGAIGLSKNTSADANPDNSLYTLRWAASTGYYHAYRYNTLLYSNTEGENVNPNDQFSISVDASNVYFYRNGIQVYSTAKNMNSGDTDPVRAMFSLYSSTAKIKDVKFSYNGLVNAAETSIGTFSKVNPTVNLWDSSGYTAQNIPYNSSEKIEIRAVYGASGSSVALGISQNNAFSTDPTTCLYWLHIFGDGWARVYRKGAILYSILVDNTVNEGSTIAVKLENGTAYFYAGDSLLYSTTVSLDGTNPLRGAFFLNSSFGSFRETKFYPVTGGSRNINRFDAHLVYPSEVSSITALDQVMGRSPGCHWQDVNGKIKFIVGSNYKNLILGESASAGNRVLAKIISYDPSQSVVKSNIVEDSFSSYKKPIDQKQNFLRTEFRDLDDQYYTKKYTYGDRGELRDLSGVLTDFGIVQLGVCTQSLADRVTESILRWNTDLDLFVEVKGMSDTFSIAKGDIVKFSHDVPDWNLSEAPTFIVLSETFEPETADERSFVLQVYNPEYYSDTDHGPISTLLPASDPNPLTAPNSMNYDYDGVKLRFYWDASETPDARRYRVTDEFDRLIIETANLFYTETNPSVDVITRRVRTINSKNQVSSNYATSTFVKPPRLTWVNPVNVAINNDAEKTLTTTTTAAGIKHATLKTAVIAREVNAFLTFSPDSSSKSQGICFSYDKFSFGTSFAGLYFNADGTYGDTAGSSVYGQYSSGDTFGLELSLSDSKIKKYKILPSGERIELVQLVEATVSNSVYYVRAYSNSTSITNINLRPELRGNLTENLESIPSISQNLVNSTYDAVVGTAARTSGTGWNSSGLSLQGIPASKDGAFYVTAFGSNSVNGSGTAVGLSSSDPDQNITSMPFWFTCNGSGGIDYYSGNTFLYNDPTPRDGIFSLIGGEVITIGRRGTELYVKVNDFESYTYTHASLDTEALILDIAFNGSLGANWTVTGIKLLKPYSTIITPEGTAPVIAVGLRDNAKIGENLVYDIPKFVITSPAVNQLLQFNASLEVVNVNVVSIDINSFTGTLAINKGGTNNTSFVPNGNTYYDGTKITSSSKWLFDGTTLKLVNPDAATAGIPQQNPPYMELLGAQWTGTVSQQVGTRIRSKTNFPSSVSTAQFIVEFLRGDGSGWQESFIYRNKPTDYLTVQLIMGSPAASAHGGILEASYDGYFSFKKLDGNLSGLNAPIIGASASAFPTFTDQPGTYSPTLRAYYNSNIRFTSGNPGAWAGPYSEGDFALGSEWVRSDLPIGIGLTAVPSARLQIRSTSEQLRIEYNASNYYKTEVGDKGVVTFDAVGTEPRFTFSDLVVCSASASDSTFRLGSFELQGYALNNVILGENTYFNGSSYKYRSTGYASYLQMNNGQFNFVTCASGTAGNDITLNSQTVITVSGMVGLNCGTSPSIRLQIRDTVEQLRIEYDASNYYKTTVGASGGVTFDAVGSGALFTFNDPVVFRRKMRVYTTASTSSLTPEIDTYDLFHITALAANITINNHSSSTPLDGDKMEIRLLDNGTSRTISYGNAYVAKAGVALPSVTIVNKNMTIVFEWNSNLSKWNLMAYLQE